MSPCANRRRASRAWPAAIPASARRCAAPDRARAAGGSSWPRRSRARAPPRAAPPPARPDRRRPPRCPRRMRPQKSSSHARSPVTRSASYVTGGERAERDLVGAVAAVGAERGKQRPARHADQRAILADARRRRPEIAVLLQRGADEADERGVPEQIEPREIARLVRPERDRRRSGHPPRVTPSIRRPRRVARRQAVHRARSRQRIEERARSPAASAPHRPWCRPPPVRPADSWARPRRPPAPAG